MNLLLQKKTGLIKPFQHQSRKPNYRSHKALLQHSIVLNDTNATDNKNLLDKYYQKKLSFFPEFSLKSFYQHCESSLILSRSENQSKVLTKVNDTDKRDKIQTLYASDS